MRTLNDPIDYEPGDDDWTPAIGMWRGTLAGLVAVVVLAVLMAPLAIYVPFMLVVMWLRIPIAFGLTWILASVVQRAAGMAGPVCALLAVALTAVALLSNHVVFALYGIPDTGLVDPWWTPPMSLVQSVIPAREGQVIGWGWFHPYVLIVVNILPLALGSGFATAFRTDG